MQNALHDSDKFSCQGNANMGSRRRDLDVGGQVYQGTWSVGRSIAPGCCKSLVIGKFRFEGKEGDHLFEGQLRLLASDRIFFDGRREWESKRMAVIQEL